MQTALRAFYEIALLGALIAAQLLGKLLYTHTYTQKKTHIRNVL